MGKLVVETVKAGAEMAEGVLNDDETRASQAQERVSAAYGYDEIPKKVQIFILVQNTRVPGKQDGGQVSEYLTFYNYKRLHQALAYQTPAEIYYA